MAADNSKRNIIIAIVVFVIIMIGIAIYAYISSNTTPPPPPNTNPKPNTGSGTGTDFLTTISNIWDKIFKKSGTYTPTGHTDCFGCDAFNNHVSGDMAGLPCDTDPSDC